MITAKLLGHIRTSVGTDSVDLGDEEIGAGDLVDRLRGMSKYSEPGFTKYNVLVMVENGDAFVPASVQRKIRSGERVVLIPFAHGG